MPTAGQAVPAMTANDVSFYGDNLPWHEIVDGVADLIDYAHEFVSNHHRNRDRLLRPCVPVIYMYVGAADRSPLDSDKNVIGPNLRNWNLLEVESRLGPAFYQRPHRFAHGVENRWLPGWRNPVLHHSALIMASFGRLGRL